MNKERYVYITAGPNQGLVGRTTTPRNRLIAKVYIEDNELLYLSAAFLKDINPDKDPEYFI